MLCEILRDTLKDLKTVLEEDRIMNTLCFEKNICGSVDVHLELHILFTL